MRPLHKVHKVQTGVTVDWMTVYNRNPGQVPEKERPAGDSLADRNPMALHNLMADFTHSYGSLYSF